jgi:hypothetical protein
VASKQVREETDVEELLDTVDQALDRLKTLYEQYFLGIQKQAPSFIHNDVERKLRDLAQMQLRNTGMRYRLATLQQKFGSYNAYWRRTLRQIENGTYARQLQKVGRDAARSGAEIPEEILAAMPKRMRDQVVRDREQALAIQARREAAKLPPEADDDFVAMIKEPTEVRRKLKSTDGAHLLDNNDADFDIDAFFAEVEQVEDKPAPARTRSATRQPQNRTRPTTTGDLIRSGTRPTREKLEPPKRAETQPIAPVRAETQPGVARATPPPIPGRATGAVPVIRDADDTQERVPVKRPGSLADYGTPNQRTTGSQPAMRAPTVPGQRTTGAQPAVAPGTGPQPAMPAQRATGPQPAIPTQRATGPQPAIPTQRATGPQPAIPMQRATGPQPAIPRTTGTQPAVEPPRVPMPERASPTSSMSSQASKPNPIAPGSAAARGAVPVESMAGPFPRPAQGFVKTQPMPTIPKRPTSPTGMPAISKVPDVPVIVTKTPAVGNPRTPFAGTPTRTTPALGVPAMKPPQRPPPGMTDADVNALYAKYVKAKEMVGEKIGPGEHGKLLKTINAQAPKIMEQYKAKGVDFSVVVKDNQVIIRAKPKT